MHTLSAPRVLLADDNVDAAELTCQLLDFHGVRTQCVFSGADAVAQVPVFRPDVVVLDIGMPQMDGHAAFRAIRALADGARVPIVALTAYNSPEEARKIRATGFAVHLVKPCDIAVLLSTIHSLARTASRARAATRRIDELTAQRVEVALVYQRMLSTMDAEAYLQALAIPPAIAQRVLRGGTTRVSPRAMTEA